MLCLDGSLSTDLAGYYLVPHERGDAYSRTKVESDTESPIHSYHTQGHPNTEV